MAKTPYEKRWVDKVERFNEKFPPGTSVAYTAANGVRIKTDVRYPAVILSNGNPVIWLVGIRDYCRFDRVVVK
jgi:hypothetical protein